MNVLILTPDAAGGTLLNSLLTIYMQFHKFDRPVIGLKDIVLGLEKYYSPEFNRELLKSNNENYQSLADITALLSGIDHYKVAKLTHYQIRRRGDTTAEQVPFYRYLNDNFYIIACRRDNVFEHALSWSINKITNRLNVFSQFDKVTTFIDIYRDGVNIDPISLLRSLDDYKDYLQWCDNNFSVASYCIYEQNLPKIEEYILDLPIFNGQAKRTTWNDVYGIEFNDWNKCHYLISDIGGLALKSKNIFKQLVDDCQTDKLIKPMDSIKLLQDSQEALQKFIFQYNAVAGENWPKIETIEDYNKLPKHIRKECEETFNITHHLNTIYLNKNVENSLYSGPRELLPIESNQFGKLILALHDQNREFLDKHNLTYSTVIKSMEHMSELGILTKPIPIKKQTLAEKALIVRNFEQCIEVYNKWIEKNPNIGTPMESKQLLIDAQKERAFWTDTSKLLG